LLASGYNEDLKDVFVAGGLDESFKVGWAESTSDYIVTLAGDFRYNDLVGSFRKVEEDAIYELCKTLIVDLQTLIKDAELWIKMGGFEAQKGFSEEISKEEISVNLYGVRVLRRVVDVDNAACIVVVKVPKSGVFTL
jgi:hypothetical protein